MTPLKGVKENKVYTIRDCVLSDMTCYDNERTTERKK